MKRIILVVILTLLVSCQGPSSNLNDLNGSSGEVITDPIPFTDIPPDITPEEGKVEVVYQVSLGNKGLTTTANLGVNIGEAGRVNVSQADSNQWHTINLTDSYRSPVVIMQPLSYNGGHPSVVRIKDVTSQSFSFQIDEWDYLDGGHPTEELSYIVLEEGIWSFKDGLSFEVGKTIVNNSFKQVNLQLSFTSPVILTQAQTYNDTAAITTRQKPRGSGFRVRVQEEEAADGIHVDETIGYIAVSQGEEYLGDVAITAGIKESVTHNFSTIDFGFAISVENEKPIFLAGMQSYNGGDPAALRYQDLSTSTVKIRVEEEQSANTETSHAPEDIGYLLLAGIASVSPPPPPPPPPTPLDGAILFVTQVPIPSDFTTIGSTFGNQLTTMQSVGRGGDLWIRYSDGELRNLTQAAGFGNEGFQGANAIAVRNPSVHWDGQKALFSMVVGAPTKQYEVKSFYWQIYEISNFAKGETPIINKINNQPESYNNIYPIYSSDDDIIFISDRPRNGASHLYPQLDEYEEAPTNSGLWLLELTSGKLTLTRSRPFR